MKNNKKRLSEKELNKMNFIKFLYYKYFRFQEKVGNQDIAPFSAMLIVSFTLILYYFDLILLLILFTPNGTLNYNFLKYFSFAFFLSVTIVLYFILVNKKKYKTIISNQKKNGADDRSNLIPILFPLLAVIIFNLGWILKMLQNRGEL